ncbi:MAG: carboxylating nicotinate-nucleotide diphosphorylase [Desulfovibrio sp.]|jgi:nicotinate-nucleotide pyrophosphorylase (carboxylating)|nr:carboxylating nicotinate-nucleotide diphosphorylase [Desulfovibrio sp.]
MPKAAFDVFFTGPARAHLMRAVREALAEDGADVAANAVFDARAGLYAEIVAKEDTVLAGLPLVPVILAETAALEPGAWEVTACAEDGDCLRAGAVAATVAGSARVILRAERVILNFLCRLSGAAALTRKYANALEGTGVQLLDTRKTAPGLRYPDKYAVQAGGGRNHRKTLGELPMLKDTHIEAAGGITPAVQRLRAHLPAGAPVEVECRTCTEALEAAACGVSRIMLDNMSPEMVGNTLDMLPLHVEIEISGGITLDNIRNFAAAGSKRKADFISVGRITHSAPAADFSMRISRSSTPPGAGSSTPQPAGAF